VDLAVSLEGEVDVLRSALSGRSWLPFESDLGERRSVNMRLVISLRTQQLQAIYGQPRASVNLLWKVIELRSGGDLNRGSVEGLMANGIDQTAANRRAASVAGDTMLARLKRAGYDAK